MRIMLTYINRLDTLDFKGIDFLVVPRQISKFEKQNNISINLYMFKKYGEDY